MIIGLSLIELDKGLKSFFNTMAQVKIAGGNKNKDGIPDDSKLKQNHEGNTSIGPKAGEIVIAIIPPNRIIYGRPTGQKLRKDRVFPP